MTILPKKKNGKEKPSPDQQSHESGSHHQVHHATTHHSIQENRVRLEASAVRGSSHASTALEERHRQPRIRLPSEFVNHAESSTTNSSLVSGFDNSDSASSCTSGDSSVVHNRIKPPSPEILDVQVQLEPKQSGGVKANIPENQSHIAKRRHGRSSPHSQPYARNKPNRNAVTLSENVSSASSSTSVGSQFCHPATRRHHVSWDDQKPISPPLCSGSGTSSSRSSRRRQRARSDGKDDKGINNSDDEYDDSRLQRLNQGINYEELELNFAQALKEVRGFLIKEMIEDGACLFRAVAEQVYGDQNMHDEVRRNCMDYMMKNSDFFSNYVTEDFVAYIGRKRLPHTYGNHLEMQAMAEMYNRSFEVYQYSTEPINTFQSSNLTDNDPIRVSYHRNSHYNAVIDPHKATVGVGLGLPSFRPGLADQMLLEDAQRASEEAFLEEQMLHDKLQAADWENTEDDMLREVAQESFVEYLRHQGELAQSSKPADSSESSSTIRQPACSREATDLPKLDTASNIQATTSSSDDIASTSQTSSSLAAAGFGNPALGDWVDENDESRILAQVLAQSQREYYDTLTRPKKDEDDTSSATCSKYASEAN